jgi:class 3 adenylate cyclase/tetratricopeptide (TPR) repeat protein
VHPNQPKPSQVTPSITEDTMKCPKCHLENREGAKFCKSCGTTLDHICPSCGHVYESDCHFCDECGHRLREQKSPLPIDYTRPDSYTPNYLANKILRTRSTIEGERKVVTVLFADVSNSSAIVEKLDPEEVHLIMDGCFDIILDRIHRYEGTINQFKGDGVMALFGAPIAHEDHAQRACYAALSIQRALEKYEEKMSEEYGIEFKMRFGINSGLVMVGAIGNDLRMDYTADGDTTYLAKRLEAIAGPGHIFISENTYRQVKAYFKFEAEGPSTLKGLEGEHHAYRLVDASSVKTRFDEAVSKGLVRFVGRENSLMTLRNTWDEATDGFGQVLGIVGEPGVGKSRLLFEFKRSLADEDIHFLECRCIPYGDSIAYLPFVNILKPFFSIQEGQRNSEITRNIQEKISLLEKDCSSFMLPAFQQLLFLEFADESWHKIEPKQRRQHIFEALKWLFLSMSKEKPLIIFVDDLHWMDRSSEEFLGYFIDAMSQNRILLVLLYRPEYTPPWANRSYFSQIGLGKLKRKSVVELTSAVLEDVAVDGELEQLILKQCGGNPLFVEEFIHSLLENDFIRRKNDRFVLVPGSVDMKIPHTIHGILATRIDRLDDLQKQILQAASAIGHDFDYRVLQTVTGMGEELKSYLDKLQHLEFIYEKEAFPELNYTFKHALIQEVAYSSLLLKRRIELHAGIGSAVEGLYADRLDEYFEILAYHFSYGEDYPKAYRYLKLSGKKAEDYFSHSSAFRFFQKALKISDHLPKDQTSDAERLEICKMMTRPLSMLGFPKGSLGVLEEGATIAKKLGDQSSLARFYNDMSLLYTARGDSGLSIAHGEKGFCEAEKIEDVDMMAPLALSLCYAYVTSSQYDKVSDIALRVAGLIEKNGRKLDFFSTPFVLYSFLLGVGGMSMAMQGDFKKGEAVSKQGLKYALESGHKMTLAFNELQCASVLVLKGDGQRALKHCQNSISYSEDIKWPTILSQGWTLLGYARYLLGEPDQAREFALKGLRIQEDSGIEAMISLHYYLLAMILFQQGELEEALGWCEKALEFAIKNHEKRYEGLSKIWIGRILGSKTISQFSEGERLILEGNEILKQLGLRPALAQGHVNLGELYRNSGKEKKALEHLRIATSMFEAMEMESWAAICPEAMNDPQR